MTSRPSFSRSSSMIVHVGDPSPVLRSPSQRPSNGPRASSYHALGPRASSYHGPGPRTSSYHGPVPNHGTRISEHARQSLPPTRRSTRVLLPSRVDTTVAMVEDVSNRAAVGSARTTQPISILPNNRRGTLSRQHQGLQQALNRHPSGHRSEFRRTEFVNIPQYRHSNPRGRLPPAPVQRNQYRPSTAVYDGRGARCTDVVGSGHVHESLVRAGGRAVHPRRM